jgi:hypothetical protein
MSYVRLAVSFQCKKQKCLRHFYLTRAERSECTLTIAETWNLVCHYCSNRPSCVRLPLNSQHRYSIRHLESMQQESPLSGSTLTPRDSQSDGPSSKITRKSHRKSRAGCMHCKSRRIKVRRPSFYVQVTIQSISILENLSCDKPDGNT